MCNCSDCGRTFDCGKHGPGQTHVTFMDCERHEERDLDVVDEQKGDT